MKPTLLFSILLLLLVGTIPIANSATSAQPEDPLAPISVFFVRHAETASSTRTNRNPALSPAGLQRAQSLAKLLQSCGVTHLFASEFQRTQSTLAALAKLGDLKVKIIPANEMATQLDALRSLPAGAVAVVCGHSNTIPMMVEKMGGEIASFKGFAKAQHALDHDAYHQLFLLTLPASDDALVKALELHYGTQLQTHHDD